VERESITKSDAARRENWQSAYAAAARAVAVPFITSRVALVAIILFSRMIFVSGPYPHAPGILPVLTTWDGAWYLDIATHGYGFRPGMAGFFPLYPLLIRLVAFVSSPALAAVLLSNLFLAAAAVLLYRLVRIDYDTVTGNDALALLLFTPASVYFSAAYTESTFLLLSVGAVLAARRGFWVVAGLCGMALSATRYVGLLIILPLAVEYYLQTKPHARKLSDWFSPQLLFALCIVPVGLVAFYIFCYFRFHDAFAYLHTTADWGRKLVPPWTTLRNSQSFPAFHLRFYECMLVIVLALFAVGIWLRMRWSYIAWAAVLLVAYLCSGNLEGFARYLAVVFPLFLAAALLAQRSRAIYDTLFVFSTAMMAFWTILLANGYWVT
jgi:hypothetical protein